MLNSNIKSELERAALEERDLEKVNALLSAGADVNLRVRYDKGTLLHETCSAKMTKQLLLHNAAIDARNMYNETPLHSAITKGKKLALVRELLKHGANVNAKDRKGNTPLHLAITKRYKNLEVISELLEYGADINIRNRRSSLYGDYTTPLDNAIYHEECAKLLIKFTLMKNFSRDYRKIINLTPYEEFRTYSELSRYFDSCVCEILQMKTDKVNYDLSLYELVMTKNINREILHTSNKITDEAITNYPIYHDVISASIKLGLTRANLLNKLSNLQVCTKLDILDQDIKEKAEVILNYDCMHNISKYLSNNDLLNFITAFHEHTGQFLDSLNSFVELSQQPDIELDEASASSCTKRARL